MKKNSYFRYYYRQQCIT